MRQPPSATRLLLDRIAQTLDGHQEGLPLTELRALFDVPVKELRLSIEAGLRDKLLRRVGSHNSLRYLSNRHP